MNRTWAKWKSVDMFQKISFVCLLILSIFMALPIIYLLNHAFKPVNELFLYPPRFIVQHPTLENFRNLFLKTQSLTIPFTRYLFNSIFTTSITVFGVILVSSLSAYAFSKHPFPGNKFFFSLTILALMFTPEVAVIPRYLIIANLHIMNTYFVHILPWIAAPVSVFLMKGFVDQVPNELIDAAKIDGAHEFTIFRKIVMPICIPAVATLGLLTFQISWQQTETSTLFTQVEAMKTLPYYVLSLTNGASNNVVGQGVGAAATLVVFVPVLIVFMLFQRRVMATMAHSGIK